MGDEPFPLPSPTPPIPHADLIRLIGEIDGISLEGDEGHLAVRIRIHGREVCVISDYMSDDMGPRKHSVSRDQIRDTLARNLI